MAWIEALSGRPLDGIQTTQRAEALLDAANTPTQSRIDDLYSLTALHTIAGQLGEAANYARQAVETSEAAFGSDHFRTALALRLYAAVLRRQKSNNQAKERNGEPRRY